MSHKDPQEYTFEDVDGEEISFRTTPFAAIKAYEMLPDVIDLVGQPIVKVLGGVSNPQDIDPDDVDVGSMEIEMDSLGGAVEALSDFLRNRGDINWMLSLLKDTYVVKPDGEKDVCLGERAVFNKVFQADMLLMAKVVFKVIGINFGGSLGDKLGNGGKGLLSKFLNE